MSFQIGIYFLLTAVVAYCCGNINGAIITSRYQYNSDVREQGSGNPGLTNFFRSYGKVGVLPVILIDMLKGIVAVAAGGIIMSSVGLAECGKAVALLFVITGHAFPAAYDFRGGKGVLVSFGALAVIDWRLMLSLFLVFLVVVALTRYVSLGSVLAALSMPIIAWFLKGDIASTVLLACCAALVTFLHRANIRRLLDGNESKLSFHKK